MVKFIAKFAFAAVLSSAAVGVTAAPASNRNTFVSIPISKVKVVDGSNIFQKDKARLASFAKAAGDVGSAPVINEDVSYIANVGVGSQTFSLIVDTGSSNTWVGAGTKFKAGSTAKSTGDSVSVSYGSGSFSGTEYTDTVTLGGLTVSDQSIGVAKTSSGFSGVDGIIGFGPEDLTEDTVKGESEVQTFMGNLLSKGTISTNVLGVSFQPESGSDTDDSNGELSLGGTDTSKYTGSITYTDVTSTSPYSEYWGITVSKLTYGSTSLSKSVPAIVDTGTTLVYIPTSAYNKFLSAAGGTTDSSSGLASFTTKPTGTVTFTVGGTILELSPSQYLIPSAQYSYYGVSGSDYYSWISDGGSTTADVNFIIGQKFLENYYAVFDTSNSRVGFATSAV